MFGPGAVRDARDRLVEIGLEADMAATYLHLLLLGASQPRAVAVALDISPAEAHRRLEHLAACGLAVARQERPVSFEAAEPARVFDVLHGWHSNRVQAIRRVQEELEPLLARLAPLPCALLSGTTFRYLTGRTQFHAEIHRLLDTAKQEVLVANTHPAGFELSERAGLWTRVRQHAESGLRQQVVMADHPALRHRLDGIRGIVRVVPPVEILRFIIVDRESILVCIGNDSSAWMDSPLEKALVTGAPGFLAAHLALFQHLWDEASAVEAPDTTVRGEYHPEQRAGRSLAHGPSI